MISTDLLEIKSFGQLQKLISGKLCFLYSNNKLIPWLLKLDFASVTSDGPLNSVCGDVKISDLEQMAKLWNLSSLLLQIMLKSTNVGILWEFKLVLLFKVAFLSNLCVTILFSNLLSDSKSIACFIKELSSAITNETAFCTFNIK